MFSIWLGFIILLFIVAFYLFLSVSLIVRLLAEYFFRPSASPGPSRTNLAESSEIQLALQNHRSRSSSH